MDQIKKSMNPYEHNSFLLNEELNRLEPFFRAEFSRVVGTEALKVINREQHPTAHIILKGEKGVQYGRLTKHTRYEQTDYDEFNQQPVFEQHIFFQLTESRYRINASVEYLFASWDTQTELDKNLTVVLQLDSQKISKYLDEFTKGGNNRLIEKGLPVINGVVGIPVSALNHMHAVVDQFVINWQTYSYTNMCNCTRMMLPKAIERAWGNYRLSMIPPKHAVISVCKETHEVVQYESLTKAALALLISNPNLDSEQGRKRLLTANSAISNCCQGRSNKVHGVDGLWYAIIDYDDAKKMEADGTLKEEIARRFARKPRKSRAKKVANV